MCYHKYAAARCVGFDRNQLLALEPVQVAAAQVMMTSHTTYRRLAVNWKNHFDRPLSANFIYILNYLVLIAKSGQNQIGRLGSIYSGSSI